MIALIAPFSVGSTSCGFNMVLESVLWVVCKAKSTDCSVDHSAKVSTVRFM